MFTPSRRPVIAFALLVCLALSACSFTSLGNLRKHFAAVNKVEAATQSSVAGDLQADAGSDILAYKKYAAQIRDYLNKEKFTQLDAIADAVRLDKSRFSGGAWKLHKLYLGLKEPANSREAPDAEWELHIEKLKRWVARKPDSITARVGLADAYTEYAWQARGRGFANTVTENGWQQFEERLATAEKILTAAKRLRAKCPHWYAVWQTVALGQGWELSRYNKLFEEAIAFEPAYHYFYSNKAQFLLPRWHGDEGDWERFADETAERIGGKQGSIIYYVIATDLFYYYRDRTFFTETKISWEKIKKGFADLDETYGTSMHGLNELCRIAGQAGDRPFTQALLSRIGDNWDPETWKTRQYFEHYKAWAYDIR